MITSCKFLRITVFFSVFIFILCSSSAQNPLLKAKSLIAEKKYDLAFSQFDNAIKLNPNNLSKIIDNCYVESIKLFKNSSRADSEKIFLYASKTLQSHYQSLDDYVNFYKYLDLINNTDSIFNLILKLYPDYSDYELKSILSKITLLTNSNFNEACIMKYKRGYGDDLWLFPTGDDEFRKKQFGLASYNPRTSHGLTKLSINEIQSIPTSAFIRSVKEDELFIEDRKTSGVILSSIPELSDEFNLLKDKEDFDIAVERDRLIKKILNVREIYLLADLKYIYSKFFISGKCFAAKSDYDFNSQQLDLHLSIDFWDYEDGIYIATLRVPLRLEDAQIFFKDKEEFWVPVQYKVSPGHNILGFGVAGGGVDRWKVQDLLLLEEPLISFSHSEKSFTFKSSGFAGYLWLGAVLERWDLHKRFRPYSGYYGEPRIIPGINLSY